MSAKRGVAPCGHPGTHITVNFVTCDQNCHLDDFEEEEDTPLDCLSPCASCGSYNTEPFDSGYLLALVNFHCVACGHCWYVSGGWDMELIHCGQCEGCRFCDQLIDWLVAVDSLLLARVRELPVNSNEWYTALDTINQRRWEIRLSVSKAMQRHGRCVQPLIRITE